MNKLRHLLLLTPVAAALTCCGGGGSASPAAQAEAQQLFESLCVTCHGTNGHGDGPGAAKLDPKPRTFADPAWQDATTDARIKTAILYGGAGVGLSAAMPAQPQLKGKDEVVAGLIEIVRGFRGHK